MKDGLIHMAELHCNEMLEYWLGSYNSRIQDVRRTVNQTVNQVDNKWSPRGHQEVTKRSTRGHQEIAKRSPIERSS